MGGGGGREGWWFASLIFRWGQNFAKFTTQIFILRFLVLLKKSGTIILVFFFFFFNLTLSPPIPPPVLHFWNSTLEWIRVEGFPDAGRRLWWYIPAMMVYCWNVHPPKKYTLHLPKSGTCFKLLLEFRKFDLSIFLPVCLKCYSVFLWISLKIYLDS